MPTSTTAERPFRLRGRWLVGTVLMVAAVAGAVTAGFWQLRRHDEVRRTNEVVEARTSTAPVPVGELVGPGDSFDVGDDVRYRRATASGTYDGGAEVLIRSRSLDGRPGYWIATPLVLDDGRAVVVNRGFVPYTNDLDAAFEAAEPPAGPVRVAGLVLPTQEREGIGPTDPPEGTLEALARLDLGRIQQQVDHDLLPVYLQLREQSPPQEGPIPTALPEPEHDSGPHLSYAGQWFLFAVIGAVGWPILLVRTARGDDPGPAPPPPRRGPPSGPTVDHRGNGHLERSPR